jgi:hypothetical protein
MDWWATNWGNVASVLGLMISIVAWKQAAAATSLVQRSQARQRLFQLSLVLERCIHHVQEAVNSTGPTFPKRRCDELRDALAEISDDLIFDEDERIRIRTWIASFYRPVTRTEKASARIRELKACLIQVKSRVTEAIRRME